MKASDVNAFKGQFKDAVVGWAGSMVDQMLPNKVTARTLFKNAIGNMVNRFDGKVNQLVDSAFLVFGDSDGVVDTDTTIDLLCGMLDEMKPTDYSFGFINATIGQGEIKIQFPHNIFSELVVGDLGGVKFTTSDIKQLKNYLS
jgi:molybdopterin-binding protein